MSEAGPSRRPRHPHPERVYTGPDPGTLADPRSRSQADKYFARVANEHILPSRMSKALGFGGWFFGGVSVVYMALFADFGDKEHVFSPLRRKYREWTKNMTTLSPGERSILGLDRPLRTDQVEGTATATSTSPSRPS